MPLIVTQGYGNGGGGGGGGGGPAFTLTTVNVFEDRLEAVFSTTMQVQGLAAVPANWYITSLTPAVPIPVVASIIVAGNTIKLYTTEARTGVAYILNFPLLGIKSTLNDDYMGPWTYNYVGNGIEPFVSLAAAEDGFHVQVIFSESVLESEALIAGNYNIPGLTVYGVSKITDLVYLLTTSLQTVGASYTVTVSNIHDGQGNLM